MTGSEDTLIQGSAQAFLHLRPLSSLIGVVLAGLLGIAWWTR